MRDTLVPFMVHNWGLIMALLVWPLITALFNVATRKRTPEAWERWALSKPALAFGMEILRAAGLDPFKLLLAFQRYAQRRAGVIPEDAVRASSLPSGLKELLLDPTKRAQLEAFIQTQRSSA